MEFTGGLILLAVAAALLFFGRGRGGDALPIFQNWLVATMFSVVILILFVAGLMAVIQACDNCFSTDQGGGKRRGQ